MSWSGFKKNVNRATTQVMMKTGQVEKTSDREYETEERRYRTLESAALRLQKEARGYLDSLRAMTASQMRIAETIDAFYGDSGAKDGVSRSYKQAVEDLDAETVKALDGPYRCVTQDPELLKMVPFDEETGIKRESVLEEIEAELNFKAGNKRNYTRGYSPKYMQGAAELIEIVYRSTVLEPINRFCAYFPDINECIKKRNHKMLDYDALRSKVKKLTEKPDKDPSKLPRTEKETEMVTATNSIRNSTNFDHTLSLPRTGVVNADEDAAMKSVGLRRSSSVMSRMSDVGHRLNRSLSARSHSIPRSGTKDQMHQSSPPLSKRCSWLPTRKSSLFALDESSTEALLPSTPIHDESLSNSDPMHLKSPTPIQGSLKPSSKSQGKKPIKRLSSSTFTPPSPFFNPSELEDIMTPLKMEMVEREADLLVQAKAAYDQLNEQLMSELPQLIDLRVPYLDPSFEALVKIQLRFCAEAYSRMAQVQQYLDPTVRDQYASGELDAKVEDVLAQIRELSIAGTV